MNATCLRCDWEGETDERACPRCGAPLFRPTIREPARRAAARTSQATPAAPSDGPEKDWSASTGLADGPAAGTRPVSTSARSVFVMVGVVFSVILFLLARGDIAPEPRLVPPPRAGPQETGGVLVYAVPDGSGAARLWRWDLVADEVAKGPLIRDPTVLVNVRSPSYGWLGITSDLGNGVHEASVLDSLEPGAREEHLGRADIVTWARQGASAVLVDRGPLIDACRREVSVTAIHLERSGRERVMDETICGDVLSVGRTSLGYFLTRQGTDGVHVVGAGYANAGILLSDHGLIAISPGGDMLVTPSEDFLPAVVPPRPVGGDRDPPPISVAGRGSYYTQFGGRPLPYLVEGLPLRIDRVLSYAPGATVVLVIGRLGSDRPGLWEVPLVPAGTGSRVPRYLADARRFTAAAYAGDGTAFVVTGGGLWRLRNHRLTPLEVPGGAPLPAGPLAWVVREPLTEL
jgi:hypothetical protein